MSGLKFAEQGEITGIAIPYGSPDRRDGHGEWFDADTDMLLDWFGERPLLLHHGRSDAGPVAVGRVIAVEKRPEGLWVRAQLDRAGAWFARVRDMLQAGSLGFSSGALAHLVKTDPSGRILRWPWVELSLTPSPASADARIYSVKSDAALAHFAAAGLKATGLDDLLADDDLDAIRDNVEAIVQRAGAERVDRGELIAIRSQFMSRWTS